MTAKVYDVNFRMKVECNEPFIPPQVLKDLLVLLVEMTGDYSEVTQADVVTPAEDIRVTELSPEYIEEEAAVEEVFAKALFARTDPYHAVAEHLYPGHGDNPAFPGRVAAKQRCLSFIHKPRYQEYLG